MSEVTDPVKKNQKSVNDLSELEQAVSEITLCRGSKQTQFTSK